MKTISILSIAFLTILASCSDSNNHASNLNTSSNQENVNLKTKRRATPLHVPQVISASFFHSCAIMSGEVQCWGQNMFGDTDVPTLHNPTQIAAGEGHTCAISDEGIKCWGNNHNNELYAPKLNHPTQISAGYYHTCALSDEGVSCWGDNYYGESTVPVLRHPTQVSANGFSSCALADDGVTCWGANDHGQTNVPVLNNPSQVSTGDQFSCAITEDGIKCWGDVSRPADPVFNNPQFVTIGEAHACALTDDGLKCWGDNFRNQSDVPATLATPTAISAGRTNNCAISKGFIRCWGNNQMKQSAPSLGINPWSDVTATENQSKSNCSATSANCTFSDSVSNLDWSKISSSGLNWSEANTYCNQLNHNNKNHWRLPTESELVEAYAHKIFEITDVNFISKFNQQFWTFLKSPSDLNPVVALSIGITGQRLSAQAKLAVTCVREH